MIYTYLIDLPVREMIVPCPDGYTVYINARLSTEQQHASYRHAVSHILRGDYDKYCVQTIEEEAHA